VSGPALIAEADKIKAREISINNADLNFKLFIIIYNPLSLGLINLSGDNSVIISVRDDKSVCGYSYSCWSV
jgi:hypothetical protein